MNIKAKINKLRFSFESPKVTVCVKVGFVDSHFNLNFSMKTPSNQNKYIVVKHSNADVLSFKVMFHPRPPRVCIPLKIPVDREERIIETVLFSKKFDLGYHSKTPTFLSKS